MIPRSEQDWRVILPMTSIADAPGGGKPEQPWAFYLTVIDEQTLIALRHLNAIWELEGDPPDISVWSSDRIDATEVWAHLQGAMFAGIVVARMFDPRVLRASRSAKREQSASAVSRQVAADRRAQRLRALLNVEDDSPLLHIRRVRDALEHFDERIDDLAAAGDVASVTDFSIALGGRFIDVDRSDSATNADDPIALRHVTMRQFSPDRGVLYFGDSFVDLFAYETALHNVLAEMPNAYSNADGSSRRARYGSARLAKWDEAEVSKRRLEIRRVRDEVRASGAWLRRPSVRPRTVVSVWTAPGGMTP